MGSVSPRPLAICLGSDTGDHAYANGSVLTRCIEELRSNTTSPSSTELSGDTRESFDIAVASAYYELREIAHRRLGRDGRGTLSTTGLVHEAYLRLAEQSGATFSDHAHFLAVASLAMRYVLVDRARARMTAKRGGSGDPVVTFDDEIMGADGQAEMV